MFILQIYDYGRYRRPQVGDTLHGIPHTSPLAHGGGEWRLSEQHLEETEDITVYLLTEAEVKALLVNDEIRQSLMAAPLWKYFALRGDDE